MVGDAVRFMLKWIVGVSDNELCLEGAADWRCSGRKWRLNSVCSIRWKQWDLAEIPREAARYCLGYRVFSDDLLPMAAVAPVSGRRGTSLCQKPQRRLISDRALKK
jgi:hypothetical protein